MKICKKCRHYKRGLCYWDKRFKVGVRVLPKAKECYHFEDKETHKAAVEAMKDFARGLFYKQNQNEEKYYNNFQNEYKV